MNSSGSGGLGRNTIGRKETMRMTDYNKHKLSHPDIACTLTSRPHRVTSHTCDCLWSQESYFRILWRLAGGRGSLERSRGDDIPRVKSMMTQTRTRRGRRGIFCPHSKNFYDTEGRKIYRLKVLCVIYVLNGQNIDFYRDESSRTESSNQLDQERFHPLRYRTQFNL